ncbi:MAG: ParA family protein [Lachnospiraceae bacterium]|nr:ParA family protein [Lachnospiraceae bacterium]
MKTPAKFCFTARKGGVGKTQLTINTAAFFANDGKRVLIIGCDQQDDLADQLLGGTGEYDPEDHKSLAGVLKEEYPAEEAIYMTGEYACYTYKATSSKVSRIFRRNDKYTMDVMPAGNDIFYIAAEDPFFLQKHLEGLEDRYDVIFFDVPPSDLDIVMMVYFYADYAVVPVTDQASFKSVNMVTDSLALVNSEGHDIRLLGVLFNRDIKARSLKKFNKQIFQETIGESVFHETIRDSADMENAGAFATPLASYRMSAVTENLYRFYLELIDRAENGGEA